MVAPPPAQHGMLRATVAAIERWSQALEDSAAKKPWACLAALSAAFLLGAFLEASHQTFWFDEILTEYVSNRPTWPDFWAAQGTTADASPPVFHVITRLNGMLLGWSEGPQRVPEILGYMGMIICIYAIARRYVPPLLALVAALLTHLTAGPLYAIDARPYSLVLGLSALGLLCWTFACEQRRPRPLFIFILWFSLALALCCHYYAALTMAAIAAGELTRTWLRRRIDWPVWIALVLSLAPLPFHLPLMRSIAILKVGNWSQPRISNFANQMTDLYLPPAAPVLGGFVFAMLIVGALCTLRRSPIERTGTTPPLYELAAWTALLLTPVASLIAGKLGTGVFVARYTIVTLIGFSLLLPLVLNILFRGWRAAAAVALVLCLCAFSVRYLVGTRRGDIVASVIPWVRSTTPPGAPIVITNALTYLELAYYLPPDFKDRLIYIPDGVQALKYTGNSTPDYNVQGLRGLAPLHLPSYDEWAAGNKRFILLAPGGGWITSRLRQDGAQFILRDEHGPYTLYNVDLSAKPSAAPW